MPRTTRKNLIMKTESAIHAFDACDVYLFEMDKLAAGRQPAIGRYAPVLKEGHEQLRRLWSALRSEL